MKTASIVEGYQEMQYNYNRHVSVMVSLLVALKTFDIAKEVYFIKEGRQSRIYRHYTAPWWPVSRWKKLWCRLIGAPVPPKIAFSVIGVKTEAEYWGKTRFLRESWRDYTCGNVINRFITYRILMRTKVKQ